MFGREQEWEEILKVLDRAGNGQGGVLLVSGELGTGKSLLLARARKAAAARGFSVAAAPARELRPRGQRPRASRASIWLRRFAGGQGRHPGAQFVDGRQFQYGKTMMV